MSIKLGLEETKNRIKKAGFKIENESRNKANNGTVLKISNGCIVNCFDTKTVNCQGNNSAEIKEILANAKNPVSKNNKVFVVYGHDQNARTQLEAMLRRWDLEPLILDQLASSGATIIEKLEEYTNQADFGIVLATPDDVGYSRDNKKDEKFRVRQNVVLELGMLLASKGREKVAILLSQKEEMEAPSDIAGLIYIPFKNNVEETKLSLAKELEKHGYYIEVSKL